MYSFPASPRLIAELQAEMRQIFPQRRLPQRDLNFQKLRESNQRRVQKSEEARARQRELIESTLNPRKSP